MEYDVKFMDIDKVIKKNEEVGLFTVGIGGSITGLPVLHNKKIYFGACDTYFYSLDLETGIKLWSFRTGDAVMSVPSLYKNVLYFGSNDKNIYAVSTDGELKWKFLTGGRLLTSTPMVVDGVVYCGSADGYMYALDASDGKLLWKFKAGSHIIQFPVVINDSLYFGSCDNAFYCISLDGRLKWKFHLGDVTTCYPAVADDKGNLVWNPALNSQKSFEHGIKLDSGSILFGSDDSFFYSLNLDGRLQWKIKTGDRIRGANTSILNGNVYFGSYDRYVRCASFETGKVLWKFPAGGPVIWTYIYQNSLYFGDYAGDFYALSLDGKELWRYHTGGPLPCCPVIMDDIAYFGSWDTYFYALDLKKQKPLWKFQTGFGFQSPVKLANVIASSDKKTEIPWVPQTKTINEYGKVISGTESGSRNPYKQKGGYAMTSNHADKRHGAYD